MYIWDLIYRLVKGELDPHDLGVTLTHEHVSMSFDVCYVEPKEKENKNLQFNLKNSSWIRQNPYVPGK